MLNLHNTLNFNTSVISNPEVNASEHNLDLDFKHQTL